MISTPVLVMVIASTITPGGVRWGEIVVGRQTSRLYISESRELGNYCGRSAGRGRRRNIASTLRTDVRMGL